jgi:dTMP kinase
MSANNLIVIEGGEACGKSTQVRLLKERLEQAGHEVVVTHEPGGTDYGNDVRQLFFKHHPQLSSISQALLLLSSKLHLLQEVIIPAIAAGKIVITDRYTLSLYVYQGLLGPHNDLAAIHALVESLGLGQLDSLLTPQLFFLDCEPAVSVARTELRKLADGDFNSMDSLDIARHTAIRDGFLHVIATGLFKCAYLEVIDVTYAPIEEVHSRIYSKVIQHV